MAEWLRRLDRCERCILARRNLMDAFARPLCVDVIGVIPEIVADAAARLACLDAAVTVRTWGQPRPPLPDPLARFPDAAILVMGATPLDALPEIARLTQHERRVPLLVLSELDDDTALLAVLRHGASGYLLAHISDVELQIAVRRLATGLTVIDPTMAGRIVLQVARCPPSRTPADRDWGLTFREGQVLDSLVEGRSNRQIGQDLNLGQETVKTYLRGIYRKLGARDRTHATAITLGRRPP